MRNTLYYLYFNCDAPWGIYFQDTPHIEVLIKLPGNFMYYLFIILFAIYWIIVSTVRNYVWNKYVMWSNDSGLEWILTSPAIILLLIALPSFNLLYLMYDVMDTSLIFFKEGDQWYWSYEYPDFSLQNEDEIVYDSYLIQESDLEEGKLRMLEVDNRVIVSEDTHIRFIVSSVDDMHILFMEGVDESSGDKIFVHVDDNNAPLYQGRPISDLRWIPMEKGEPFTDSRGLHQKVHALGNVFVYDRINPNEDPSKFMHGSYRNHIVKKIQMTDHYGFIKRLEINQDSVVFAVDQKKFEKFAAIYDVTSNNIPVHVDTNGKISVQRG